MTYKYKVAINKDVKVGDKVTGVSDAQRGLWLKAGIIEAVKPRKKEAE